MLTWYDIVIIVAFLVALFGVSAWVTRRKASREQFFLAGRTLTWPFIGFALIAINVGARYVIGFAGLGFKSGVLVGHYEIVSTLNLVVLCFLLLPLYRASGVYTMPQLLRHRYGQSTHLIYSIIAIVCIFLTVPAGTFLFSKTLAKVTDQNMWTFVWVIVPICVLLQVWGGLRTVAYADMFMGVMILVGGGIVVWCSLSHPAVGGLTGLADKIHKVDPELLQGFRQAGKGVFIPWQAVFTGVFLIGLWFWCVQQMPMQMVLAARTLNDGRRGALLLALLKYLSAFLVLTPGLCGRLIYPTLPEKQGDAIFGMLLRDQVGPGLTGLVIAALGAAVISTLMSLLNAASTMFTNDIVQRLVPKEKFETLAVPVGRAFVVVAGGLTLVGVAIYAQIQGVMEVLLKIYSLIAGPTLAVYLLGIFWRRANAKGANIALIIGLICSFGSHFLPGKAIAEHVGWLGEPIAYFNSVNNHYRALLWFGLSSLILIVVSLLTKAPSADKLERTTWAWYRSRRHEIEARAAVPDDYDGPPKRDPWYLDYRLWSAALLALLLATWWLFGLSRIWKEFL